MKRVFLTLLLLVFVVEARSQAGFQWFDYQKIPRYIVPTLNFSDFAIINGQVMDGFQPGYFIDAERNKIEGEIQYNFPYIMERMMVFRKDGEVNFYKPTQIKGYFIDGIYRESVLFNAALISGAEALHTFFMIPRVVGALSIFYYTGEEIVWQMEPQDDRIFAFDQYMQAYNTYIARQPRSVIEAFDTEVIQKSNERAIKVESMVFGYANKMAKLTSDCADVSAKVKAKQTGYKSTNFLKIVKEYNECIGNQ